MKNIKPTLANFLRRYIEFENTATPAEAMGFIKSEKNSYGLDFLKKTEKLILEGFEQIRPFVKFRLSKNVYFYSTANKNKNLLICFCGTKNRLMMPIPVFLQYIDHKIYDVLVLRDPYRLCYHSGIPGFGLTLENSANELADIVLRGKYQQVKTFGTSGGGYASLCLGLYLNVKKAISVGGCHPSNYQIINHNLSKKGLSGYEFDELLSKRSNQYQTSVKIIYADGVDRDTESAKIFAKHLCNANLIPIDHDQHNVINYLRKKQKLRLFMDELINNEL